ncbi:MAG: hypothetical protein U0525_05160 [Patescibacteria group bacterium]
MADIKPVPETPEIPRIPKFKLIVLGSIIIGAIALGITIQMRHQNQKTDVLGESAVDIGDVASDELQKAIGDKKDLLKNGQNPEKLLQESQDIIASKTAELGNVANQEVEKISSQAAHNVTDFIYKNSIERVIDTLIKSLPEERQKKYEEKK